MQTKRLVAVRAVRAARNTRRMRALSRVFSPLVTSAATATVMDYKRRGIWFWIMTRKLSANTYNGE
jgi:hypothetical protein